ncbi:hypothetical protein ACHQM5_015303 [Ranunculus cassubicifolius]
MISSCRLRERCKDSEGIESLFAIMSFRICKDEGFGVSILMVSLVCNDRILNFIFSF